MILESNYHGMREGLCAVVVCALVLLSGCKGPEETPEEISPASSSAVLRSVGTLHITEEDLAQYLRERYQGRNEASVRERALGELVVRARWAQAALEEGLGDDPLVRLETANILANRYREELLFPKLKATEGPIEEALLREIYEERKETYQSPEKRHVAVLWLNPGDDPERKSKYEAKLEGAREWLMRNEDLVARPEEGFAVLSVDHSEHHASRFKGGVVGWFPEGGGSTKWEQILARVAFSLETAGEVSAVISDPEGIFLVRLMAVKKMVGRSFEAVRSQLEADERRRIRLEIEADFERGLEERFP